MPKEMVRNSDGGPWFPKVGWSPGRDVQLGVENDEERSLFWILLGEPETMQRLGSELRKEFGISGPVENATDEVNNELVAVRLLNKLDVVGSAYRGLWTTLGRREVNDLIRRLRKARDSAFGKDE